MSSKFCLIVVGKLKNQHIQALEQEYLKRLKSALPIYEVKSHGDNIKSEENEIKNKIQSLSKSTNPNIVLLSEHGQLMNTKEFASFVSKQQLKPQETFFIIGGSQGFQKSFFNETHLQLSLSPMIFPHKLARLIFVEQFYRAELCRNKIQQDNLEDKFKKLDIESRDRSADPGAWNRKINKEYREE